MATGTAWSNYAETLIETFMLTAGTATRPTTWYVSLHTADPGESGLGAEVSGGSYARVAVTFNAPSAGATANSGVVTFPTATASWGTVVSTAIWDSLTGGNMLKYGALTTSVAIGTGTTYTFAAGNIASATD
jgi:hypothetical protein